MSQKSTRKKRLKTSQNTSNLPRKEDSDIANYFKDCLTLVPDVPKNNENQLPPIPEARRTKDVQQNNVKVNINSRSTGTKSKLVTLDSLVPPKKWKVALTDSTNNLKVNNSKDTSHDTTPTHLSVSKSPKSLTSFKSNRSNIINNISESFTCSKILSLQTLSHVSSQKRFELSTWGLPPLILEKYQARGINSMFPWQVECLANKKILEENKNLVYSAPTSAGKTLVAEFLVLKTVLERRKKAIFILPFVSVVREKMFYFQDLLCDSGVRVEGFMGGVAPAGGFSAVHVAIATIEKANSLVNRLMENGDLDTLGAVVIDELHLLGDPGRGYLLELLLTKLRYMTLSFEHIDIQLIGMSATLPNLPLIAEWLDAELYKTDFRPIPLFEQCKIGSSLYDNKLNAIRDLEVAQDIVSDTDNIIQLCIETINGGHGVLVFCPSKNWCEKLATQMAATFFQLGRDNTPHGQILRKNIDATAVQEVLIQLTHCPVGLDSILKKTVSFGVAFHHAGLTMDERDIIEGGFRVGSLKVLIATSTLSSGVNLPARRVIIRSPIFNGRPLDKLSYQQMIGRAGRMGKDTAGESILMCKQNERAAAAKLLASSLEPIESCLESSGPLIRALLEAIASQIVRTPKDLDFYSKCTFVYKCDNSEVSELVDEAVHFLITNEFLLVKDSDGQEKRMVATCLGQACLSASIPPREGLFLFEELQRARKCFVLDTELHVVYLVTPFNYSSQITQIDWMIFLELWRALSESERRVGQLVGVEERFLMTAMRGIVKPGKTLNIHQRFFTALALHDLVREVPINTVCRKYGCCRGLLQSLQQSSSTFAGMVTNFCKELKWDCMELLFAQFQARLQFGVCRDLLDLLRLPSLNGLRARSLFKNGITSVAELAVANELDVEEALNKALPFESEKDFDGENEAEIAKRTKMRTVFITGKDGLTAREAAQIVIKEARVLVKNELGVCDVQWSQVNKDNNQLSSRSSINTETSVKQLSIANDIPLSRNVSVEIHTIADETKDKISKEPMEIIQELGDNVAEKTGQKQKCPSKIDIILSEAPNDIVHERDKPESTSRTLGLKFANKINADATAEKTIGNERRFSKNDESPSISAEDVTNKSDKSQSTFRTHRSKLADKINANVIVEKNIENEKRLSKSNERPLMSSGDIADKSEKLQSVSRTLRSKLTDKTNTDIVAKKIIENEESLSKNCESLSASSEDVINESDKPETTFRTLRSRLAEKTKSILKDDQITINTIDFQDETNSRAEVVPKNKVNSQKVQETLQNKTKSTEKLQEPLKDNGNSQSLESFQVSERALDEIMQVVEEGDKNVFQMPAAVNDAKVVEEKKRVSASSNYSKSPSLFSDSSFMDPQICSILEKNVIDSACFADFEKSNFTPQNQPTDKVETTEKVNSSVAHSTNKTESSKTSTPTSNPVDLITNRNDDKNDRDKENSPPKSAQLCEVKTNDPKQTTVSLTWTEVSWDQPKNQQLDKEEDKMVKEDLPLDSPSLLKLSRVRGHLRPLAPSQMALNKMQSMSSKEIAPETPFAGTPKSILQKLAFDKGDAEQSPIASVRTYNTRKPFLSSAPSSNKSDSEDSIVNSQATNTRQTTVNKTRSRIEKKLLMNTQKLAKSIRSKKSTSKVTCTAPKVVKQNSKPFFEDPSLGDDGSDSSGSCLMFDSDDTGKSQEKKIEKRKKETPSVNKIELLRADSRTSSKVDREKINSKAIVPVNVANSRRTFRLFRSEIEGSTQSEGRTDLAIALVTETCNRDPTVAIGNRIVGTEEKRKKDKKSDTYIYRDKKLCGIVISWGIGAVYYMPFNNTQETKITIKERLNFLRDILTNPSVNVRCFNAKEVYKMLYVCCEIEPHCGFLDPKAGNWLMNSDACHNSYTELAAQYFPKGLDIANNFENSYGTHTLIANTRAAAKALLAWYITEAILEALKERSSILSSAYKEIEMPTILILARMELRGFGINMAALQELTAVIKNDISRIEEEAFGLAGKKFNFYSSKEVSQVLGLNKKGRACTNKNALRSCEHPISNLVTLWRKLNTVQTKIVFPLLQLEKKNNRIHGNCIPYTVTGRISMHEPNLQTIPRDFKSDISGCILSVRMAFIPTVGNVMLSADFCQLELRILAHFSQDPVLCKLMYEKGDIFKNIAARLNQITEDKVDDDMRQRAKQLCYAMIYGMGTKSLAETLCVTESEAKDYLEAFMSTYKGIRVWLNSVHEQARIDGFVSTLTDRQRVLPGIISKIPAVKAQAERQAVNTKVQGSAADITKKAMVLIESKIQKEFSYLPLTFPTTQSRRNLYRNDTDSRPRGAYLILQLHDELLYEVNSNDLQQVASIVKESMEHSFELRVPLPVKIRVGTAWGNLEEYQI